MFLVLQRVYLKVVGSSRREREPKPWKASFILFASKGQQGRDGEQRTFGRVSTCHLSMVREVSMVCASFALATLRP